jgi:hypothetical protein
MIDYKIPLSGTQINPVDNFNAGRQAKNALAMQQAEIDSIPIKKELQGLQLSSAKNALAEQQESAALRQDAMQAMEIKSLLSNPQGALARMSEIMDPQDDGKMMVFDLLRSGKVDQAGEMLDQVIGRAKVFGVIPDTSLKDQLTSLNMTIQANEEARKQELAANRREDRLAAKQAEERAIVEGQKELETQSRATREQAAFASKNIERLLSDDLYKSHFGSYQWRKLNPVSAGSRQDAKALVDQVVGMVTVDARGKLKGQGTITDTETQLLANAETILSNPDITEDLALAELMRVDAVYKNAAARANGKGVGDIDLEALDTQIESRLRASSVKSRSQSRRDQRGHVQSLVDKYAD